ncbi:magnesium transporter CorA [Candidatus Micrarchaeota archaeon]|nr:magnesium transporter CorA [Candidatus Micrarchaeota archaeon]
MPLNKDLLHKMRRKHGDERIILSLEEKGFCVAQQKDGRTEEMESRDVRDFLSRAESCSVAWVDYIVEDLAGESPAIASALGFSDSLVSTLLKNKRSGYEDLDDEMGVLIPAIIVNGFDVKVEYLLLLLRNGLVATIHTTEVKRFFRLRRYAKIFMRKIKPTLPSKDKLTHILVRIIDENNARNFDHLREIEENSDKLSAKLSDVKTPREEIGKDIHLMKHALITYLNALWETVDVLNTLRYGDPEILTDDPKLLTRLHGLVVEVNNQIGLAEHMSEVLASGLEVMQSIYNNQLQILNNKLALLVAYLTVLGTAFLVPNTIATALGSSAFALTPADQGWYLALLLGSTIVATVGSYLWVLRMGLLPKKAE